MSMFNVVPIVDLKKELKEELQLFAKEVLSKEVSRAVSKAMKSNNGILIGSRSGSKSPSPPPKTSLQRTGGRGAAETKDDKENDQRSKLMKQNSSIRSLRKTAAAPALKPPSEPILTDEDPQSEADGGVKPSLNSASEEVSAPPPKLGLAASPAVEFEVDGSEEVKPATHSSIMPWSESRPEEAPLLSETKANESKDADDEDADDKVFSQTAQAFVKHPYFEHLAALAVCANAAVLGYETNCQVMYGDLVQTQWSRACENFFCVFFTLELLLRIACHGPRKFYLEDGWQWSVLDTVLVGSLLADQAARLCKSVFHAKYLSAMRIFRIFRIIRITRAIRMFHLLDVLAVIVNFMSQTFYSAMWALFFFMVFLYIFSVLVLQLAMSYGSFTEEEEMERWFGSLDRTFLTLFECALGSTEWEIVASTLNTEVSSTMRILFLCYIMLSTFVVSNLLMSVFMETAIRRLREDLDPDIPRAIDSIFHELNREITWEDFSSQLEQPALREYLKSIDVYPTPENARAIFELIDIDGGGTLSTEELVDGALRLRGPGRALELQMVLRDTSEILNQLRH